MTIAKKKPFLVAVFLLGLFLVWDLPALAEEIGCNCSSGCSCSGYGQFRLKQQPYDSRRCSNDHSITCWNQSQCGPGNTCDIIYELCTVITPRVTCGFAECKSGNKCVLDLTNCAQNSQYENRSRHSLRPVIRGGRMAPGWPAALATTVDHNKEGGWTRVHPPWYLAN